MLTIRNMLLALLLGVCMALATVWFVESAEARPAFPGVITCRANLHPVRPLFNPTVGIVSLTVVVKCDKPVRTSRVFLTLLVKGVGWERAEWSKDPRSTVATQTYPWTRGYDVIVQHKCRRPHGTVLFRWSAIGFVEWWNGRYTQSGYLKSKGIWIPCI